MIGAVPERGAAAVPASFLDDAACAIRVRETAAASLATGAVVGLLVGAAAGVIGAAVLKGWLK